MSDDDLYEYEDLPSEPDQPAKPVDENSLSFILGKALKDIDQIGGITRAKLADLVGRKTYDMLLSKPKVADAIDAYLNASPRTKKAAGRMLALHIGRATDHSEMVDAPLPAEKSQAMPAHSPTVAKVMPGGMDLGPQPGRRRYPRGMKDIPWKSWLNKSKTGIKRKKKRSTIGALMG